MIHRVLRAAAGVSEALITPLSALSEDVPQQRAVLEETEHRPWALPNEPWFMGQTWCTLLFAHWPVPAATLRPLVPPQLPIDEYEGSAWIGVTPFVLRGFRLRGTTPAPLLSTFPELNVRTYVTVGAKPGIFFMSLDAASRLAVRSARRSYRLPYFHAEMRATNEGDGIRYTSRRTSRDGEPADFEASYRPAGSALPVREGSLERWLAERYCLYTLDERGNVLRADIHHPPWPLQPAEVEITRNTMAEPWGIALEGEPLAHYSERQDTLIWSLRLADAGKK